MRFAGIDRSKYISQNNLDSQFIVSQITPEKIADTMTECVIAPDNMGEKTPS